MMSFAETRVLFVVTAGPRRADTVEHYLSIARALGVRPLVAVPGARGAAEEALVHGADVIAEATPAVIRTLEADVVVVDDPVAAQVGGWIIAAQRAGALVVTAEDLGLKTLARSAARNPGFLAEFMWHSPRPGFGARQ
jgi:hypothetical protein